MSDRRGSFKSRPSYGGGDGGGRGSHKHQRPSDDRHHGHSDRRHGYGDSGGGYGGGGREPASKQWRREREAPVEEQRDAGNYTDLSGAAVALAAEEAHADAEARRAGGRASTALPGDFDTYGKGDATDRLQFGYSPAVPEEAVAFHALFPAAAWKQERQQRYRKYIAKGQPLPRHKSLLEPLESVFKVTSHWELSQQRAKGGAAGAAAGPLGGGGLAADDFLAFLSRQNLGPAANDDGDAAASADASASPAGAAPNNNKKKGGASSPALKPKSPAAKAATPQPTPRGAGTPADKKAKKAAAAAVESSAGTTPKASPASGKASVAKSPSSHVGKWGKL